jgi:hypothetical protein
MKDLVLRSVDKTVDVHYLVDLVGSNSGLMTIHEIRGLSDAEIALGINFKRELVSLGELKEFATENNLGLFVYETGQSVQAIVDLEPTLTLTILDIEGNPISGISVSTDDELEDDDSDLTTDENGQVEVEFSSTGLKTIVIEQQQDDDDGDDDGDDDDDDRVFESQEFVIDMFADQSKIVTLYEVEVEDDDDSDAS